MKSRTAEEKEARRKWLLATCEETRQRCNKLTDQERRRLREKALAFIHGHHAKATAGSR
jgi:hypothetical protein